MANEVSLNTIEERIGRLEDSILDNESMDTKEKCIEKLMNIQSHLQSAVTGREKITSIFSKMDNLEKYLNPSFKDNMTLSDAAKLDLILLDEERIRNAVDSLQTIKDTVHFLDSEHIKSVPSLSSKLVELSEIQIKQQKEVEGLAKETKSLIGEYNTLITEISKLFILWDSVITEAEKTQSLKVTDD